MTIYRIYKTKIISEYDGYTDDYIDREEDETIKFVSTKEKIDEFFKSVENKNNKALHCFNCPIIKLTKRQYDNGKHINVKDWCSNKDLYFERNRVYCKNEKAVDFDEYNYEEIEVE